MLYGRTTEQARIAALLTAARDERRSGVLVLRGEAGIGKSALLDAAAAECAHVVRATGFEAETGIAFAGLNQLLWPVRDRLDALPGPQAAALRAALSGPGPAAGPGDRFTTGLAMLTLLADLADEAGQQGDGPLLCLVDDAQWLDSATAETLLFAARRLAAEGVVMLFAARDEAFTGTGLPELRLERLAREDAERVLAARRLPLALRDRIVRESEGNPLALLEFGGSGQQPRVTDSARPLPVADRVAASFRAQIAELPERTRLMLLIASAEGRGYMPSLLGAARVLDVGLEDLEPAERAGLVEVTGRSITFRHPLIRSASYQGAAAARRLAVHRALADTADDLGCRARHRASAAMAPDEDVALDLQRAAHRARDLAGYATAASLYRQAAELTPAPEARAARLGEAAALALRAGQPAEADDLAATAEKLTRDPALRARLGRVRATVECERGDSRTAASMLVEHAGDAAPADRAAMLRTAATYAWNIGAAPTVLRAAGLLPGDRTLRGLAHLAAGDPARGLPLLTARLTEARAAEPVTAARNGHATAAGDAACSPDLFHTDEPQTGDATGTSQAATGNGDAAGTGDATADDDQLLHLALIIGADGAALELAAARAAHHRRHGLIGALPAVLQAQAEAYLAVGRHADAEAAIGEAAALARDTGMHRRADRLGAVLARIPAIEGDEARLRELTGRAPQSRLTDGALALLDLGHGRHDEALRRLLESPRGHSAVDMQFTADQVEAAVRAGDPDRAREAYERFRAWAEAGDQLWALAVAARCRALLDDTEEPYEKAVRLHLRATRPFERARTELLYGEWLRRARRRSDARGHLRSAVDIFERLRAAPWLDRARTELRATGESGAASTPTAPNLADRLTPQELQVVRLAAEGTSSREIAAQLFLSPRTVEYHLYKAYPKLGISSRKELSRLPLEPAPT